MIIFPNDLSQFTYPGREIIVARMSHRGGAGSFGAARPLSCSDSLSLKANDGGGFVSAYAKTIEAVRSFR